MRFITATTIALTLIAALPGSGAARIIDSRHNLSAGGAGARSGASNDNRICIYCHTSHSAGTDGPLWNRDTVEQYYIPYSSSTLEATVGQPNGVSKLCLSCHDGTVALGRASTNPRVRPLHYLPEGSNLGTDLSDDHPISFRYDRSLAIGDTQLRDPLALDSRVKLDARGRLQCTTCHNPHSSNYDWMLVMDNTAGGLCRVCHEMDGWLGSAHADSDAITTDTGSVSGIGGGPVTVADNACRNCHANHAAQHPEQLLIHFEEETNCLRCHDGDPARHSIELEMLKTSAHRVGDYLAKHDPAEDPLSMPRHVECQDCHNSHAVNGEDVPAPAVTGNLRLVPGLGLSETPIPHSANEYEVCLKCHSAAASALPPDITRDVFESDLLRQIDSSAISYHPITAEGRNADVPSLLPEWSTTSFVRCIDCHNNDNGPAAGGSGPDGPHGSNWPWLLERQYLTADLTSESRQTYELCYKCHDRDLLLSNQTFVHREHVVDQQTPCSACHDPHGIDGAQGNLSANSHLINFDTSIVEPEPGTGTRGFVDLGARQGQCTLACHGTTHVDRGYLNGAPQP